MRPVAQKGRGCLVRRNSVKMAFPGVDKVSAFDERGPPVLESEQQVRRKPCVTIRIAYAFGPTTSMPRRRRRCVGPP